MNRLSLISVLFLVFLAGIKADAGDNRQKVMKKDKAIDSPFGALEFFHWNHAWNQFKFPEDKSLKRTIALMKKAGVSWVRMDFLWGEIEPGKNVFDFAKYDKIVELLTQNGINVLGLLNYSADWASSCRQWNCPPADNSLFVNYAVAVVKRYKDRIKYWEVWNEPDSATYWKAQDDLKSYCLLLKDTYRALKEVDPLCKVLNGGLANGLASVNKLYDNGAKDYFDILNIHIFESPLHRDAIKRAVAYPKLAYKIMSRNGDGDKKIWISEIGCPGVKKGLTPADWWLGANPDEARQAEWAKEVLTSLLRDRRIEKIFWAFFRDCNAHWNNGVDYFGLIRWDYSLKPAFKSYRKCVRDWNKAR